MRDPVPLLDVWGEERVAGLVEGQEEGVRSQGNAPEM